MAVTHLEFQESFMPTDSNQQRGNSGAYLQGRNELRILDSFGLNMSFPPLSASGLTRNCRDSGIQTHDLNPLLNPEQ